MSGSATDYCNEGSQSILFGWRDQRVMQSKSQKVKQSSSQGVEQS